METFLPGQNRLDSTELVKDWRTYGMFTLFINAGNTKKEGQIPSRNGV